jgi:hypothetical protein
MAKVVSAITSTSTGAGSFQCVERWKPLTLVEIYFLGGVEYRRAISLVGVAEDTFDYWLQEVKKAASRGYSRTGLYPASDYLQVARRAIDSLRRIPSSKVAA